ncbi:hypothetical protein D3C80_129300 [compost metagenome]
MNEHLNVAKLRLPDECDPLINPDGSQDFFDSYLTYTSGTEVPAHANRWSAIGMLGAWLGRDVYVKFGSAKLYANQYIMLLGEAGSKKSTAIKGAKRLLKSAGYNNFSAEKISKEKFLTELAKQQRAIATSGLNNFLDEQLFGEISECDYRETWICADEFNDFFANNIFEFVSTLGVLWDYEGKYENQVKHGESVVIPNPTVSILSGNTPTTFATTFPIEAVGQGFFSRVLAVHIRPSGRKITRPKEPSEEETGKLVDRLMEIKNYHAGEIEITEESWTLIDRIYKNWKSVQDSRFEAYGNRRLTHLLKLCLIHAASRCSQTIDPIDIRRANTVLDYTEHHMPDAFGEFGTARNSGMTHKIIKELEMSDKLMGLHDLWAKMQLDFDKLETFQNHVMGMVQAEKLQMAGDKLLPKKRVLETPVNEFLDYRYMSDEERGE